MRLLIIDDHQMFVDGLVTNLKNLSDKDIHIVVKHDVQSALGHLEEGYIYNLIMLDLNMPELDGFQFMDTLIDRDFHFPIVILSGSENSEDFIRLRDYNIAGFIAKKSSISELQQSLQTIFSGERVIPNEYAIYFHEDYEGTTDNYAATTSAPAISNRKVQILSYMEKGLTNKQIAEKLFITANTVKGHIKEIYQILDVNSRVECVRKAKDQEII